MSWDDRLLVPPRPEAPLAERVAALLDQQRQTWSLLQEGEVGLAELQTRRLQSGNGHVVVQNNPRRRASSAARVDPASVAQRPCFLCVDNLPAEERGVPFDAELVIAPNPFPIVPDHLSVISRQHGPQRLGDRAATLMSLACALGPEWLVLYNGPRCGASAPDHFHFQAGHAGALPIAAELTGSAAGAELLGLHSFGRQVLVLQGVDASVLSRRIERAVDALARIVGEAGEPMLNLVATCAPPVYTVYLFPRSAHRPSCFYAEGEAQLLISPGALDMAGLVVVAEPAHFDRVDLGVVTQIFEEVSLDRARFDALLEELV